MTWGQGPALETSDFQPACFPQSLCDNGGLLSLASMAGGSGTHQPIIMWLSHSGSRALEVSPTLFCRTMHSLSSLWLGLPFTWAFDPLSSSVFLWLRRHRSHGKHLSYGCNQSLPFVTPHAPTSPPLTQNSNLQIIHLYYSFSTQNDSLSLSEGWGSSWDLLPATQTKYLLICFNYVFFVAYKEVVGPSLIAWGELINTSHNR